MAASKDTFESKSFASNTFAAGVFRGTGAASAIAAEIFYLLHGTDRNYFALEGSDRRLKPLSGTDRSLQVIANDR